MAKHIEVDVNKVTAAAKRIHEINNRIRDDFHEVEGAIRSLNASWNSQAASTVIHHFSSIKNAYHESRYMVMKEYSKFLHTQVSGGYSETESKNTSLADAFK